MTEKVEDVGAEDLNKALKSNEKGLPPEVDESGKEKEVEKTAEELAHDESSRLGRKYKYLEDKVDNLVDSVDKFISSRPPAGLEIEEDLDEEIPITRRDLNVIMDKRDKESKDRDVAYDKNYLLELGRLTKDMTDEEAKSVLGILEGSYNSRSHADPIVAAALNLNKAEIEYLRGSKDVLINPLNDKGSRTGLPSGLSGGEREKEHGNELPELDGDAQEFLKKSNMSKEEIKDALEGDSNTLKRG